MRAELTVESATAAPATDASDAEATAGPTDAESTTDASAQERTANTGAAGPTDGSDAVESSTARASNASNTGTARRRAGVTPAGRTVCLDTAEDRKSVV